MGALSWVGAMERSRFRFLKSLAPLLSKPRLLVAVDPMQVDEEIRIQTRDPLATIRRASRTTDLAALFAVPALLLAVGALPAGVREAYAFAYDDPTLLTAFTAHYVHFSAGHLLLNVGTYLLVAPLAYALAVASGRRRRFLVAATTFLVAFPVVLSALNLAVTRPGVSAGFSGINAAFVGYVAFALPGYVGRFGPEDADIPSPWLFFFALAGIALVAVPTTVHVLGIAVAAVLSGVLFLVPEVGVHRMAALRRWVRSPGGLELGLFGFGVVAVYPFLAFPASPIAGSSVVNLYAHLLGFALGFMATYVTEMVRLSGRVRVAT